MAPSAREPASEFRRGRANPLLAPLADAWSRYQEAEATLKKATADERDKQMGRETVERIADEINQVAGQVDPARWEALTASADAEVRKAILDETIASLERERAKRELERLRSDYYGVAAKFDPHSTRAVRIDQMAQREVERLTREQDRLVKKLQRSYGGTTETAMGDAIRTFMAGVTARAARDSATSSSARLSTLQNPSSAKPSNWKGMTLVAVVRAEYDAEQADKRLADAKATAEDAHRALAAAVKEAAEDRGSPDKTGAALKALKDAETADAEVKTAQRDVGYSRDDLARHKMGSRQARVAAARKAVKVARRLAKDAKRAQKRAHNAQRFGAPNAEALSKEAERKAAEAAEAARRAALLVDQVETPPKPAPRVPAPGAAPPPSPPPSPFLPPPGGEMSVQGGLYFDSPMDTGEGCPKAKPECSDHRCGKCQAPTQCVPGSCQWIRLYEPPPPPPPDTKGGGKKGKGQSLPKTPFGPPDSGAPGPAGTPGAPVGPEGGKSDAGSGVGQPGAEVGAPPDGPAPAAPVPAQAAPAEPEGGTAPPPPAPPEPPPAETEGRTGGPAAPNWGREREEFQAEADARLATKDELVALIDAAMDLRDIAEPPGDVPGGVSFIDIDPAEMSRLIAEQLREETRRRRATKEAAEETWAAPRTHAELALRQGRPLTYLYLQLVEKRKFTDMPGMDRLFESLAEGELERLMARSLAEAAALLARAAIEIPTETLEGAQRGGSSLIALATLQPREAWRLLSTKDTSLADPYADVPGAWGTIVRGTLHGVEMLNPASGGGQVFGGLVRRLAARALAADMARGASVYGGEAAASSLSRTSLAAREQLRGLMEWVGTRDLPLNVRRTFGVRIQRAFATATVKHPGVSESPIFNLLERIPGMSKLDWQQHHIFIQRRWFALGRKGAETPSLWYGAGEKAARLGLQRLGNAGWNLVPLPGRFNAWLDRTPGATELFAAGAAASVPAAGYGGYKLGEQAADQIFGIGDGK